MHLSIERRAEIALRSLQKSERKHVERALNELLSSDRAALQQSPKLHKLASGFSGRKLFVYRASPKLRLVVSLEDDVCVLEDIVDHDRLDRLLKREGQE